MKKYYLSLITIVLSTLSLKAQTFTKIVAGPVTNSPGDSRSVNWVDVNNDEFIDLFISNGPSSGQNNSLFINNGSGNFTAVTSDTIVKDNQPSDGSTWADCDNDGDLDCYVVNWYNTNNLFYLNNGAGTFTRTPGLVNTSGGYCETAAWGDYDKDGFIDLYVTNSAGVNKNLLFKNNGDNTFTKIITGTMVNDVSDSRSVNWTDIDNDGDLDLFVTNESNQNESIYRNDGAGLFTNLTSGILLNDGKNTMSSSWGDYDNDGDMDVFLANDAGSNGLFRNDGNFVFTKIVSDTVSKTNAHSFSSAWSDIDNDGDIDLFVTNAFNTPTLQLNFLYLNNGNGSFTRVNNTVLATDLDWSYGCAFGDYDNDGFEDLAVATCRFNSVDRPDLLYHNDGNSNKWVTLKLVGTVSNKSAIGTKIRVKAIIGGNPVWQMREISAQSSYCGQNDIRAHFGLGNATIVDSIKIEWPLGMVEYYTNVTSGQFIQYVEGASLASVKENSADLIDFKVYPNPSSNAITIVISSGNFDKKDRITITDLLGKTITEINPNNTSQLTLDLQKYNLKSGNYLIKFNRAGKQIIKKIIFD